MRAAWAVLPAKVLDDEAWTHQPPDLCTPVRNVSQVVLNHLLKPAKVRGYTVLWRNNNEGARQVEPSIESLVKRVVRDNTDWIVDVHDLHLAIASVYEHVHRPRLVLDWASRDLGSYFGPGLLDLAIQAHEEGLSVDDGEAIEARVALLVGDMPTGKDDDVFTVKSVTSYFQIDANRARMQRKLADVWRRVPPRPTRTVTAELRDVLALLGSAERDLKNRAKREPPERAAAWRRLRDVAPDADPKSVWDAGLAIDIPALPALTADGERVAPLDQAIQRRVASIAASTAGFGGPVSGLTVREAVDRVIAASSRPLGVQSPDDSATLLIAGAVAQFVAGSPERETGIEGRTGAASLSELASRLRTARFDDAALRQWQDLAEDRLRQYFHGSITRVFLQRVWVKSWGTRFSTLPIRSATDAWLAICGTVRSAVWATPTDVERALREQLSPGAGSGDDIFDTQAAKAAWDVCSFAYGVPAETVYAQAFLDEEIKRPRTPRESAFAEPLWHDRWATWVEQLRAADDALVESATYATDPGAPEQTSRRPKLTVADYPDYDTAVRLLRETFRRQG